MPILTLTPDQRAWSIAAVLLLGCAGLTLSSHLHARFFDDRDVGTVPVHVLTSSIVLLAALPLVGLRWVLNSNAWCWRQPLPIGAPVLLLAGLGIAALVIAADPRIARALGRGRRLVPAVERQPTDLRPVGLAARTGGSLLLARDWTPTSRDLDLGIGLPWLLATALVEESIFRGVALNLVLRAADAPLRVLGVLAVLLAFALSHIFFGWSQVAAKLPLSVLGTAAALLTGSVLPAAIGHLLFNAHVWRQRPLVIEQVENRVWR
ncbi:MAG: CPBP family intramembrane metalloprotease [Actinomycetota bacterium]|nr:CPBP family intramembrane metalloprotease [Actinomycetota bacterium]MDQ2959144.1 CPBP family intramembrane metalloprotease [Actinomycetota bacterium]